VADRAERERVIAVAMRYIGYGYQHHHIPGLGPPARMALEGDGVGHNGKGVDCSNFTGFVYNQGFGIRLTPTSAAAEQDRAEETEGSRPPPSLDLPRASRTGSGRSEWRPAFIRGMSTAPSRTS